MSEEILSLAAYREVYGGNPVFRDRHGKPWMIWEGKPTALANGQEPTKQYYNVRKVVDSDPTPFYAIVIGSGYPDVEIDPKYVNSNIPIPNEPPTEFKDWFVDELNRVVPPAPNDLSLESVPPDPVDWLCERERLDWFSLAIYCAIRGAWDADHSSQCVTQSVREAKALIAELDKTTAQP